MRVEVPSYKLTEYKVIVESGRSARADMQVIAKGEGDEETDAYYVIKAKNLMVQKEDLGVGNWSTADAMCKASILADYTDWRLPTKEELMVFYNNRNLIGGFQNTSYWSSTKYSESGSSYWYVNFSDGALKYNWDGSHRVRAVRTINPTPEEESYVTLPVVNLMVQKEDLGTETYNFNDAYALCKGSIVAGYTDWRLPTYDELMVMYNNKDLIGGFKDDYYMSSTSYNDYYKYVVLFESGVYSSTNGHYRAYVRAVRTIAK